MKTLIEKIQGRTDIQKISPELISLFCQNCGREGLCGEIGRIKRFMSNDNEVHYLCNNCDNVIVLKGNPSSRDIKGYNKKMKRRYGQYLSEDGK